MGPRFKGSFQLGCFTGLQQTVSGLGLVGFVGMRPVFEEAVRMMGEEDGEKIFL